MDNIITNSLYYKKDQIYLFFDVESCSLNTLSTSNKIWQLGFLLATREEILEEHNIYINWPDLQVSKGAAQVTGFNEELVKKEGKDPLATLLFFEKYLYNSNYRVVFFNGLNFDSYLLSIWYKALNRKIDYNKFIDRCIDVRALVVADKIGAVLNEDDNFLFWQYRMLGIVRRGLKSNLAQSCKDYGVKSDNEKFHDGLFDCKQTKSLFFELLKRFNIK